MNPSKLTRRWQDRRRIRHWIPIEYQSPLDSCKPGEHTLTNATTSSGDGYVCITCGDFFTRIEDAARLENLTPSDPNPHNPNATRASDRD